MDKFDYMNMALEEAEKAAALEEVPVGALLVQGDIVIARAHNMNRQMNNPIKHAEMMAIEEACKKLQSERLLDCELYVTKEPCAMCAGAIIHARIKKIVIATEDPKYGACGTVLDVCGNSALNHVPEIEFGVLKEESIALLQKFFKARR